MMVLCVKIQRNELGLEDPITLSKADILTHNPLAGLLSMLFWSEVHLHLIGTPSAARI